MSYTTTHDEEPYCELNVDSGLHDFGTEDEPYFNLSRSIKKVTGIQLISAEIPYSFYIINSECNTIKVNATVLTLAVGNYTTASLITEIQLMLNGGFSNYSGTTYANPALGNGVFTANILGATNIFTLSCTIGNFTITVPLTTSDANINSLGFFLGFLPGTTSSSASFYRGAFVVDLSGPNYLYLRGNFASVLYDKVRTSGVNIDTNNVIAKIPLTSNPGGIIFFNTPNPTRGFFKVGENDINTLNFYFTLGINTTPIQFNGETFSLKLGLLQGLAYNT